MTLQSHVQAPGTTGATAVAARSVPRPVASRRGTIVATTLVVGAGLAWLTVTSAMAASGRRLAGLEAERAVLLERRAAALTAHAAATDPRVLEEAARRMGFAPQVDVERLSIAVAPRALAAGAALDPESPLAIMREASAGAEGVAAEGARPAGEPDMPALLLSVGAAEAAHADEIAGVGGTRR